MKKYVTIFALLLAIIIPTCLFVGCGGGNNEGESGGEGGNEPTVNETVYTLRALVITSGENSTRINIDTVDPTYNVYKEIALSYGSTVSVTDTYVRFSGQSMGLLGNIEYTKSGDNITFNDESVQSVFNNSTLTTQLLGLSFASNGMAMIIEYYAGDFVPEFDIS